MEPECPLYNGVEMHITRIKALEAAEYSSSFTTGDVEYPWNAASRLRHAADFRAA
jgi:hypothetical protein